MSEMRKIVQRCFAPRSPSCRNDNFVLIIFEDDRGEWWVTPGSRFHMGDEVDMSLLVARRWNKDTQNMTICRGYCYGQGSVIHPDGTGEFSVVQNNTSRRWRNPLGPSGFNGENDPGCFSG